ncbi:unnamed protein product [Medioppia subpectinata]|uniref:transketolase n=1 Tax=Medioppia subpectinata TaxID=1979941 RepID=A0A7R9KWH9_9ACAR|nr:unnamed protein product [Medioppia subpectinata]CAG2110780.1 unnamed protein product [Medioppia subpectinata]
MERAMELCAQSHGIAFIRTSRPTFPVIYKNDEPFAVGKAKVVRKYGGEQVLLIGAGVTLHEALKAADELASKYQIKARVIDPFTIKPIDKETIIANAKECGGKIITIEDHYPEGGLGEAVASAVASENIRVQILAVRDIPRSGPPQALIDMFGIGSKSIVNAVLNFK